MHRAVDAALIGELFDRHAAALEFYCSQLTTTSSDCVQEAFLELSKQTECPDDPVAWLFRVARNRALNAVRAARRRSEYEEQAGRHHSMRRRPEGPFETVALHDLLNTLTDTKREIVVLRIWGRLSWQEIANVVDGSRSATQRTYVQALEQLRNHWEPLPCATNTPTNRQKTRR